MPKAMKVVELPCKPEEHAGQSSVVFSGLGQTYIRKAVREGVLHAWKVGRRVIVETASIDELIEGSPRAAPLFKKTASDKELG